MGNFYILFQIYIYWQGLKQIFVLCWVEKKKQIPFLHFMIFYVTLHRHTLDIETEGVITFDVVKGCMHLDWCIQNVLVQFLQIALALHIKHVIR